MYQTAQKLYSLLWSTGDGAADQDDVSGGSGGATGREELRYITGTVTAVHGSYGVVDGEIFFALECLGGAAMPEVGATLEVSARRKHGMGGWKADSVRVLDPRPPRQRQDEAEGSAANANFEDPDVQKSSEDGLVGIVTSANGEKGGFINDSVPFALSDITYEGYTPSRGDCIILKGDFNSDAGDKVLSPLRVFDFEGVVRFFHNQQQYGFIDSEEGERDVHFVPAACEEPYRPRQGDAVCGKAVETTRGQCQWRAFLVRPAPAKLDASRVLSAALRPPTQTQKLRELCMDKEGIRITETLDFGRLEVGRHRNIQVWIRNVGQTEQTLLSCVLRGARCSQFAVAMETEGSALRLGPGRSTTVTLTCTPRNLGVEEEILVFDFDGFSVGRVVKVTATGLQQDLLDPSAPYQKRKIGGRPVALSGDSWLVPGQRPVRQRPTAMLPRKLPQYAVPSTFRTWVLEDKDPALLVSSLAEELCLANYSRRFSALLHLEEIQQEVDIRDFDLDRVCLRGVGEFLGLTVPGLSEGRPSVLVGDRVILTTPGIPDACAPEYEGYVHQLLRDEVLLKFHSEFHSEYTGQDYNVRFTFNRSALRRCHQAVESAASLPHTVLFPDNLIPKISQLAASRVVSAAKDQGVTVVKVPRDSGVRKCPLGVTFKPTRIHVFFNEALNDRQRAAVLRILHGHSRPTPYLLFGPPGTGKTVTVVEAILQVFTHLASSRIVACAPSNSAADLLALRLQQSGLLKATDLVRLNAFHRDHEQSPPEILAHCCNGDDLENVARRRVLVATCTTAGLVYTLGLRPGHYTHVFVDEAGQATEPECLIPVGLAATGGRGQVVLAGDPMQLGPVLQSRKAKDACLDLSLLERLIRRPLYARDEDRYANHGSYNPLLVTKLVENYRSHPAILSLPSQLFYHGELVDSADKDLIEMFCNWEKLPNRDNFPVVFHGLRGEDVREGNSPSWFNPAETLQVIKYLQSLLTHDIHPVTPEDIGVITPYRKQVEKIRLLMETFGIEKVKVGSVEEFQGQERKVIIISTVRSTEGYLNSDVTHNLGFVSNAKRFNVAVTRAQALLVVVGNPYLLSQDRHWRALLDYCCRHNAYVGCALPPQVPAPEDVPGDHGDNDDVSEVTDSCAQSDHDSRSTDSETDSATLVGEGSNAGGTPSETAAISGKGNVEQAEEVYSTKANDNTAPRAAVGDNTGQCEWDARSEDGGKDAMECNEDPDVALKEASTHASDNPGNLVSASMDVTVTPSACGRDRERRDLVGDRSAVLESRPLAGQSGGTPPVGGDAQSQRSVPDNGTDTGIGSWTCTGADSRLDTAIGTGADSRLDTAIGTISEVGGQMVSNTGRVDTEIDIFKRSEPEMRLIRLHLKTGPPSGPASGLVTAGDAELHGETHPRLEMKSEAELSPVAATHTEGGPPCATATHTEGGPPCATATHTERGPPCATATHTERGPPCATATHTERGPPCATATPGAGDGGGQGVDSDHDDATPANGDVNDDDNDVIGDDDDDMWEDVEDEGSSDVRNVLHSGEPANEDCDNVCDVTPRDSGPVGVSSLTACDIVQLSDDESGDDENLRTGRCQTPSHGEQEPPSRVPNDVYVIDQVLQEEGGSSPVELGLAGSMLDRSWLSSEVPTRGHIGELVVGMTSGQVCEDVRLTTEVAFRGRFDGDGQCRPLGGDTVAETLGHFCVEQTGRELRPFSADIVSEAICHVLSTAGESESGSPSGNTLTEVFNRVQIAEGSCESRSLGGGTVTAHKASTSAATSRERSGQPGTWRADGGGSGSDTAVPAPAPAPGSAPGSDPGSAQGSARGSDPGSAQGSTRESAQGSARGSDPGSDSGSTQGSARGSDPGSAQGSARGSPPGSAQGSARESVPGSAPGTAPGTAPGSAQGSAPGSAPGSTPGSGPGSAPGSAPSDTEKKIIRQIEYYFGDLNLLRDAFLLEQIAANTDGYVAMSTLVTFKRLKQLSSDFKVIAAALRKSASGLVEVSGDGEWVRRSLDKPLSTDHERWKLAVWETAILVDGVRPQVTMDIIQDVFERFGSVSHVERRIRYRATRRGAPFYKNLDLVVFADSEGARRALHHQGTLPVVGKCNVNFRDDLTTEGVEYFYDKMVKGLRAQQLLPLGARSNPRSSSISRSVGPERREYSSDMLEVAWTKRGSTAACSRPGSARRPAPDMTSQRVVAEEGGLRSRRAGSCSEPPGSPAEGAAPRLTQQWKSGSQAGVVGSARAEGGDIGGSGAGFLARQPLLVTTQGVARGDPPMPALSPVGSTSPDVMDAAYRPPPSGIPRGDDTTPLRSPLGRGLGVQGGLGRGAQSPFGRGRWGLSPLGRGLPMVSGVETQLKSLNLGVETPPASYYATKGVDSDTSDEENTVDDTLTSPWRRSPKAQHSCHVQKPSRETYFCTEGNYPEQTSPSPSPAALRPHPGIVPSVTSPPHTARDASPGSSARGVISTGAASHAQPPQLQAPSPGQGSGAAVHMPTLSPLSQHGGGQSHAPHYWDGDHDDLEQRDSDVIIESSEEESLEDE